MRVALMALLMIPLVVGCISAKTTFRDFSDLSDTPYTYVEKNASFTHTTAKALCLFRSNPFRGAGPLYEGLHKQYQLGPNEAFINQRFDTVNKFWLFFCERDYTLSADIVRFSHNFRGSAAQSTPQSPIIQTKPTSGVVTVVASAVVEVKCPALSVTGRPNPTTGKSTVRVQLSGPMACQIEIEDRVLQIVLSPGESHLCSLDKATVSCANVGASK
jgi:hypothetical protein